MSEHNSRLMSIGEVAKSLHITRRMILNYEDKGILLPDVKTGSGGNRYYTPETLTRIRAIFALCFASPFATFFHPRTGDKLCLEACQAWQTRKPGTKTK